MKIQNIKYIDLFAGIGGFRLALDSFGGKCVFTSEIDKHAQQVYKANYGDLPEGDIAQISSQSIPAHNILCGGFPCQPFSISGKQKGFDDIRGTAFFEIIRIAEFHQPQMLLLENVKNFATHNQGQTLKTVISSLNKIGYEVNHQLLNASHFGLPQNRERIFFVAFRKDLNPTKKFQFPKPTHSLVRLKDIILTDSETKSFRIQRGDVSYHNTSEKSLADFPQKPVRIGTVGKGGQGERIYHENGHAITLSAYGGGIGAKTGLYLINGHLRKLAPAECARLQGFPDNFKLTSSTIQSYKQLGNAVPVEVLKSIVNSIALA